MAVKMKEIWLKRKQNEENKETTNKKDTYDGFFIAAIKIQEQYADL